jgi:hypothetical protein
MFQSEDFGKPISEELSENLKKYTSKDDRADVSIKTGISVSTIRDVVYRANMLTENNSIGIIELIKVAIANIETAAHVKSYLEQLISVEA